jgi:hypothetical protein
MLESFLFLFEISCCFLFLLIAPLQILETLDFFPVRLDFQKSPVKCLSFRPINLLFSARLWQIYATLMAIDVVIGIGTEVDIIEYYY